MNEVGRLQSDHYAVSSISQDSSTLAVILKHDGLLGSTDNVRRPNVLERAGAWDITAEIHPSRAEIDRNAVALTA